MRLSKNALLRRKCNNFELSNHIPSMMRLPTSTTGWKPGRTSALLEEVDLFPTLVDLALGETLETCPDAPADSRRVGSCTEGHSFAPVLREPTMAWKPAVFWQGGCVGRTGWGTQGRPVGYTIRVAGWRYTQWVKFDSNSTTPLWDEVVDHELYPHSTEPERCEFGFEHVNVVSDPAHAQTVKELAAGLRAGWKGALPSGVVRAAP